MAKREVGEVVVVVRDRDQDASTLISIPAPSEPKSDLTQPNEPTKQLLPEYSSSSFHYCGTNSVLLFKVWLVTFV